MKNCKKFFKQIPIRNKFVKVKLSLYISTILLLILSLFTSCGKQIVEVKIPDSTKSKIEFLKEKYKILLFDSTEFTTKNKSEKTIEDLLKKRYTYDESPTVEIKRDNLASLMEYFAFLSNSQPQPAGNKIYSLTNDQIIELYGDFCKAHDYFEWKMTIYNEVDLKFRQVLGIPFTELNDDYNFNNYIQSEKRKDLVDLLTLLVRKYVKNKKYEITEKDVIGLKNIADCKHFIINSIKKENNN